MSEEVTPVSAQKPTNTESARTGRLSRSELSDWVRINASPYQELMAYCRCAMMEVETKFNVLNEELSLRYDRNPIEAVKTRLKSPESVIEKLGRKGCPLTVESIEENISDIAGVRVICAFPSDIYKLADMFLLQDDITLIEEKDYFKTPKENGYRSLHLVVETPIFLHDSKRTMKVEVQFRTISMDWWASLEHKIRYKKDLVPSEDIDRELLELAEISAELDIRMERIMNRAEFTNSQKRSSAEAMWRALLAGGN
jgi:putative GTP pyrophosphokinase